MTTPRHNIPRAFALATLALLALLPTASAWLAEPLPMPVPEREEGAAHERIALALPAAPADAGAFEVLTARIEVASAEEGNWTYVVTHMGQGELLLRSNATADAAPADAVLTLRAYRVTLTTAEPDARTTLWYHDGAEAAPGEPTA